MDEVPDPEELIEAPPPEASLAATENRHVPYVPLRLREYRLYLFGNLAVNMGASMQSVAVGWELHERTGSAMALGWVGLMQARDSRARQTGRTACEESVTALLYVGASIRKKSL